MTIPEQDRWRGGRGPIRFSYTYEDLADLFDVSIETIRHWASKHTDKQTGKVSPARLDPRDLRSVLRLMQERQARYERIHGATIHVRQLGAQKRC